MKYLVATLVAVTVVAAASIVGHPNWRYVGEAPAASPLPAQKLSVLEQVRGETAFMLASFHKLGEVMSGAVKALGPQHRQTEPASPVNRRLKGDRLTASDCGCGDELEPQPETDTAVAAQLRQ